MGMVTVDSNWLIDTFDFSARSVRHQAGDRFQSAETAAFALMFNPASFICSDRHPDGREHSANIYRINSNVKSMSGNYTFQQVRAGNAAGVNPASPRSRYGTLVAQIHTHGAFSPHYDSEVFSTRDLQNATVNQFLATPGGNLLRADFISEIRGGVNIFANIRIIATGLPSDSVKNWYRQHRPHMFN